MISNSPESRAVLATLITDKPVKKTAYAPNLTVRVYSDTGLTDGQDYYYKVQAHNTLGYSTDSSVVSTTLALILTSHASPV